MAKSRNAEVICFKVDGELLGAMKGIANRSQFIRSAVLAALENLCPLCRGSGTLTVEQRRHWNEFARAHAVVECGDCRQLYVRCSAGGGKVHSSARPCRRGRPGKSRPRKGPA